MQFKAPRVVIAGLKGGSGKTTLSIGLISCLRQRGLKVIPFKKGPDYIDSGWLSSVAKSPCYNLDPFLIGEGNVIKSFIGHFHDFDIAVIEGNRGIYDGMDVVGTFSTARLSRTLKAPVILIIDCTKMTRTSAALILGAKKFDPYVKIKGVILNYVAGKRHESIVRESIERYCSIPVLGAIPRLPDTAFPERHMGLTPYQEHPEVKQAISRAAEIVKKHVSLDRVIEIAKNALPLKSEIPNPKPTPMSSVRVGVIRDSAFQFYYPENLEELQKRGASLIEVSALTDKRLPEIDVLYIGGGFPETHAISLSGNTAFKKDLLKAIEERGLPVYAECGGLMYLGESLIIEGRAYPMAGVFPIIFSLQKKPEAHGYTIVEVRRSNLFYDKGTVLRGHEFHYSKVLKLGKKSDMYMAFKMKRGKGIINGMDGLCRRNVLATYTHIHALGAKEWVEGMLRVEKKAINRLSTAQAERASRMS